MTPEKEDTGHWVACAQVPTDQRFTWKLTPLPGRLLDASTVGKTLESVCDILTHDDKSGRNLFPALMGIRMTDAGEFEADIALLEILATPTTDTED